MSKFKKGDKVRVLEPDIKRNREELDITMDDIEYTYETIWKGASGSVRKIRSVESGDRYLLEGIVGWCFKGWMLEPVEDAPLTPTGENVNRCVCCGEIIPEGRQVCPACESSQEPHIKDSGERTEYATGAVRDCKEGKGRFDLVPLDALCSALDDNIFGMIGAAKCAETTAAAISYLDEAILYFAETRLEKNKYDVAIEVSKHFEEGAKKYGPDNWRRGIPVHSYIDSALRHYSKYMAGWTDEPHDRAFVWNLLCCSWTMKHHPELDDWTEKVVAADGSV